MPWARMAKACAYLNGRDYVSPGDVEEIFLPVAIHRAKISSKARIGRVPLMQILGELLEQVAKPTPKRRGL